MDLTKLSDQDLAALQSGDLTKLSDEGLRALQGGMPASAQPADKMGMLGNAGMGALKGAADIGATLLTPFDYALNKLGVSDRTPAERRETLRGYFENNADPQSLAFKGGELGAQIAGTAGAGGALAKGMQAIPALARFAPAVASGGFSIGNAATANPIANAALRAAGGAIQGGTQAAMVNPSDALEGAGIGALMPSVVKGAAVVGDSARRGMDSLSKTLMQSALKPTLEQLKTGKAEKAVATLLREGISPTAKGVEKLGGMADDLDSQVKGIIAGSGATVSKADVLQALDDLKARAATQVNPSADLNAIAAASDEFKNHPMLNQGNNIPIQLAQDLKTGTYKSLKDKAYGEIKGAATEAQKALARGLREGIEKGAPEVGPLNARQSDLINAMKVAQRRVLVDTNKNPAGLALVAPDSARLAAFLLDRSAAAKGLAARGAYSASRMNPIPKAIPNFMDQYGLLGAPSLAITSP